VHQAGQALLAGGTTDSESVPTCHFRDLMALFFHIISSIDGVSAFGSSSLFGVIVFLPFVFSIMGFAYT
jgi:hypothetical protein